MTVVVLGVDALDPYLVDPEEHPNLTLEAHHRIETLVSSSGEPSTHEVADDYYWTAAGRPRTRA